jgi:hypothetical protein
MFLAGGPRLLISRAQLGGGSAILRAHAKMGQPRSDMGKDEQSVEMSGASAPG